MGRLNSSLSLLTACVGVAAVQPSAVDFAAIYSNNEPAMVFVSSRGYLYNGTAEDMTGSGFFVNDAGLILTNDHVTFSEKINYKDIVVTVHPGSRNTPGIHADIVWSDPLADLALLQIPVLAPVRSVVIGRPARVPIGSRLAVMGFPLTSDLSIVDGLLSSKPSPTRWQTSAPLNPGNSGGPVFSSAGDVIGVVASGAISATIPGHGSIDVDGINYFIPIDLFVTMPDLDKALARQFMNLSEPTEIRPPPMPRAERLARTYVVSQVQDDHLELLTPTTRTYRVEFAAEPGYRITSARLEELSGNFARDVRVSVAPAGERVDVTFALQSGPLIDQYRAWLHANVHTEQRRRRQPFSH